MNLENEAFQKAMTLLLKREGGYVDHPLDRGGPTNMGITMQTLGAWRASKVTELDVQNLELEEAMKIYKSNYWNPLNLDKLNDNRLSIIFFDQAVNRGTRQVAKEMQKAVGVRKDGIIGPNSLSAINNTNPILIGLNFIKYSQIYYTKIVGNRPSQMVFLKGWLNRTHHLLDILFWKELNSDLF